MLTGPSSSGPTPPAKRRSGRVLAFARSGSRGPCRFTWRWKALEPANWPENSPSVLDCRRRAGGVGQEAARYRRCGRSLQELSASRHVALLFTPCSNHGLRGEAGKAGISPQSRTRRAFRGAGQPPSTRFGWAASSPQHGRRGDGDRHQGSAQGLVAEGRMRNILAAPIHSLRFDRQRARVQIGLH